MKSLPHVSCLWTRKIYIYILLNIGSHLHLDSENPKTVKIFNSTIVPPHRSLFTTANSHTHAWECLTNQKY